ncbi:hypothetical protein ShirakiTA10_17800 [Bacillus safensis]|nr:hypothetical protein ShirakiTA10_17800 [Bacillus safensis]
MLGRSLNLLERFVGHFLKLKGNIEPEFVNLTNKLKLFPSSKQSSILYALLEDVFLFIVSTSFSYEEVRR